MKSSLKAQLGLALLTLALFASACGSEGAEPSTSSQAPSSGSVDMTGHGEPIEVSADGDIPEIEVAIAADQKSGQNLTVELTNFTLTPENASTDPVDNEGHLHLYINGERTLRFYNTALHLDLPQGKHTVEVEVSANNHSAYAKDGEPIRSSAEIDVPKSEGDQHGEHGKKDPTDVAGFDAVPAIDITVTKDPKSGWNVHAPVEKFAFSVDNASSEAVDGEGHIHLNINGEQATRLYGEWWHIDQLPEGDHTIEVELRGNDHAPLVSQETPISATTTVSVSAEEADAADHDEGHGDKEHSDEGGHEDTDDGHHGHGSGGHGEASGSEAVEEGTSKDQADVVISATFTAGNVEAMVDGEKSSGSLKVERGSVVAVEVTSDVEEMVHVHGHDILVSVTPDTPGLIVFTADIPGKLEIEMEESGALILNLQVS